MTTTQSEYYKKTIAKSVITGLGDCAFKVSCTQSRNITASNKGKKKK